MTTPTTGEAPKKPEKRKLKKYTAAERKQLGLDKMPENKFGDYKGRNPRFDYDPRGES